ncbi:hypothetical protein HZB88_01610 [archaeon]|nr:hypothetical protein [archaeon]
MSSLLMSSALHTSNKTANIQIHRTAHVLNLAIKRKSGKLPIETLISFIALSFVFFIFILIFLYSKEALSSEALSSYACWATNGVKNGGAVFTFMPSACSRQTIDEPVDKEKFVRLLRRAWWMYGRNKWETGIAGDDVPLVYTVTMKEDLPLQDFFTYIYEHNKGRETKDITKSDYNYFEETTPKGQSLCFDAKSESIGQRTLKKDKPYYILFYDDQEFFGEDKTDMVLISEDPNFDRGYWASVARDVPGILAGGVIYAILAEDESGVNKGCVIYTPIGLQETKK